MSRKVYIYGLKIKNSYEFRYIGKTTRPNYRLREHLKEKLRKFNHHKINWINKCKQENIDIVLEILSIVDELSWEEEEKFYIQYYRELGHNLTNILDGGQSPQMLKYVFTYEEAKIIAHKLNIKTTLEWRKKCKNNNIPNSIPKRPDLYYLDNGWISWSDWLNSNIVSNKNKKFYDFQTAKKIVKTLNIKSNNEWRLYCKSNNKDNNIPSNPDLYYLDDGWISWSDWLGYDIKKIKKLPEFLNYDEAKKVISKLGLKTHRDWIEYSKTNRPNNIPSNPWKIYLEWKGIKEFLN